jgi:hypothetical protein
MEKLALFILSVLICVHPWLMAARKPGGTPRSGVKAPETAQRTDKRQ